MPYYDKDPKRDPNIDNHPFGPWAPSARVGGSGFVFCRVLGFCGARTTIYAWRSSGWILGLQLFRFLYEA